MKDRDHYRLEEFPESRIATMDIGAVGREKHHIRALIELDVTKARQLIAERKRAGEALSFNSWLIKCIGTAVEEFRDLHGIRKGKRHVVLFDDIDISVMIEREIQGTKVPLPCVIRKVNEKSIAEINEEIRQAKQQPIDDEGNFVLGEKKDPKWMKLYYGMPGFLRRLVWRKILQNPFLTKRNMGTVIVTSPGMMGKIRGWMIPVSVHPIAFAVGSIVKKPGVKDDRIEIREYLFVTVAVDHDVIDGAPAVRALSRLTSLIERGAGL